MVAVRIACAIALILFAATATARELRGASFEDSVVVALNSQRMGLIGVSAVERNYLSFYVAGLYVGQAKPDPRALGDGQVACRIALQWLAPTVSADAARAYWLEEFGRSTGDSATLEHLKGMINRFVAASGPIKRGDVMLIDYDPEMGLSLTRNGSAAGRFPGVEFARGFLRIWFGEKAPAERRDELLGRAQPVAPKLP